MINEKEIREDSWLDEKNQPHEQKVTALHLAAQNNDIAAVNSILQSKVDVNALTEDGWTALHFAAFKGYTQVVKALLNAGINVDIQGKFYQRSALHYAADGGHLEVVKDLLAKGANTKLLDKSEKTAFDIAQKKGFTEIADLLRNSH